MTADGWTLLFHDAIVGQLENLAAAAARARKADAKTYQSNANVKLLAALARLMFEIIPTDPARPEYRQGNTLGQAHRHWFRAKFMGRFRLFFRYDSRSRLIVYAWVNDDHTLRQSGGKRDPYAVFQRMLASGHPPDDWVALIKGSRALPADILPASDGSKRRER